MCIRQSIPTSGMMATEPNASHGVDRESQNSVLSQEAVMEEGEMNGALHSSSKNDHERSRSNRESLDLDDDGRPRRQGTMWTATSHVITAVIGSGVLSLAWSLAQLGWVAGPLVLLAFAFVTYYTAILLTDSYRSQDPITGSSRRNYSYMEAVSVNFSEREVFWCGLAQYSNLVGSAIGYTITSSISMVAVQRSNCFHNRHHSARCHASNNPYMAAFGICQLVFSQIPDFDRIWWLSVLAAVMSFFYASVALGLGLSKVIVGGHANGTVGGIPIGMGPGDDTTAQKTWHILQALGNIAFAYSFTTVIFEIQDTIRGPPKYEQENKTMRKATLLGVFATTFFYMGVAAAGYLAFGNSAPGNILTGFGFYNPYWLVDLANIAIVVHLLGAYQVYAQPVFAFIENLAGSKWPNSTFIHQEIDLKVQFCRTLSFNWFRLLWRSSFVIFTTVVAMSLPFFNDVTGLIGACSFWPLTVHFPVEMYMKTSGIKAWTRKWAALETFSFICLLISIGAGIGSVEGLIRNLRNYKPFHTVY